MPAVAAGLSLKLCTRQAFPLAAFFMDELMALFRFEELLDLRKKRASDAYHLRSRLANEPDVIGQGKS
eukprot:s3060_g5.t1